MKSLADLKLCFACPALLVTLNMCCKNLSTGRGAM